MRENCTKGGGGIIRKVAGKLDIKSAEHVVLKASLSIDTFVHLETRAYFGRYLIVALVGVFGLAAEFG